MHYANKFNNNNQGFLQRAFREEKSIHNLEIHEVNLTKSAIYQHSQHNKPKISRL